MEVAIYFKNGNTAYFTEVTEFVVSGQGVMTFKYFGVASQKSKQAMFYVKELAGYSTTY